MIKRATSHPQYAQILREVSDSDDSAHTQHYYAEAYYTSQGEPLYSSETPHSQSKTKTTVRIRVDIETTQGSETEIDSTDTDATANPDINTDDSEDVSASSELADSLAPTPTPAIMARKREENRTTFASLNSHDLPVVREYSAGGLIFDNQDRVAIIARHSRSGHLEWCLPKGHIEKGETPEETAVREVHEETGILGEVVSSIATIDYWFTGNTQRIHKLVHHYALRQTGGELTVEGDPDHEAEDAIWVKFDDLCDVLSYPNERRIVWLYARKYKKKHE